MQTETFQERPQFADPADRATYEEQLGLETAIREALRKKGPELRAVGSCHNCHEVFGEDEQHLRFCDEDCRDDYQHRMTRRRVNGTLH